MLLTAGRRKRKKMDPEKTGDEGREMSGWGK